MTITFENVGRKYRKLITKIYDEALKETQNDHNFVWATITFVDKERIAQLNKSFRNVDRATDVLSFPMLNIKYPQKLADFKRENEPDGSLYLGDVVICKKVAKEQAKQFGHSKKREVGFLALHGLLHLLGYDHIEEDDEKIMTATSKKILENLSITRGKQNV